MLNQTTKERENSRDSLRLFLLNLYLKRELEFKALEADQPWTQRLRRNAKKDKMAADLQQEIEQLSSLYGDLFILEARIEGKLPAYEGILIVKERKSPE